MLVFSGLSEQARRHAARIWAMRRLQGKLLSVLRLAKASATFSGGIEYLAWKISAHSGAPLELRPWQRRFPIMGAIPLLPTLIRTGSTRSSEDRRVRKEWVSQCHARWAQTPSK